MHIHTNIHIIYREIFVYIQYITLYTYRYTYLHMGVHMCVKHTCVLEVYTVYVSTLFLVVVVFQNVMSIRGYLDMHNAYW